MAAGTFEEQDAPNRLSDAIGYSSGVPIAGGLGTVTHGKAPGFAVAALKELTGASLDRTRVAGSWMER